MIWKPLSRKQRRVFTWWTTNKYDALICDGSVRSGKTICMSTSFVMWAMTCFDNQQFALCGKTIGSLRRNMTNGFASVFEGIYTVKEKRSENLIEISDGEKMNRFYLFGGKDESSQDLIQGMTLAGVLFDEVALMPESFVNQATARCSISGRKFWFNCNPSHPEHWFYLNWIRQLERHKALHLHFQMIDNLSLDAKIRADYESQYSGVFYNRYILGEWCKAEGRVYPMFDENLHVFPTCPLKNKTLQYFVSVDYGTVNPFSAGLWAVDAFTKRAYRMREYYHDSRKTGRQLTDEEYYEKLDSLIGQTPVSFIVVDPSAASFIECIRRHRKYRVRAAVNDVDDGIRVVAQLLNSNMIAFDASCKDSIREFGLYSWDEKHGGDKVIKEYDHAMDDIRYFCNTVLRREFRWVDWR